MITTDDIKNLAHLARIEVAESEGEKLAKDMDEILAYVGEISAVVEENKSAEGAVSMGSLKNVFRDDAPSHEKGEYTESILANAPAREGNYVKVKKIL
ncbi:Asp-tRNA(Asn)/Glu-tRNA(Gln) amidotransferase subunit GatC [bacterium]|nr:Asp-tRNA(Asn)/Glu-tRNA(Gln) amidotransferase subunit GatC [bacterium]